MIGAGWRRRLSYGAMSVVVGWHSLAILIAPLPDASGIVQGARLILRPYLSLFRLENNWNFFAPVIGRQVQVRYVVEDADGQRHAFIPANEFNGSIPRYVMWREFKYLYDGFLEEPEVYAARATELFCRKHAALKPIAISIMRIQELDFWPDDYLQGHRPLDSAFVDVSTLTNMSC